MKVTFNAIEMAGLMSRTRRWEKDTGEKASVQFVITMLSTLMSTELDTYVERVFDMKTKILQDMKIEDNIE